ncbi:hypothetical protein QOZ80_8BG0661060 [Eleusine coracana subsp. coracana]|nr:hypothetical protein QOZ80_8BG0661060 [Eleusine coracana subsp. coracana]
MALPELIDDAIAEILLRLPPDEPSFLVRASLVCKSWCRLLSDPAFLRRYREFHRAPPLLGFLRNLYDGCPRFRFVPTAAASPFATPAFDGRDGWAIECRHGRALLDIFPLRDLVVWDPVTGDQRPVPAPVHPHKHYTAAVLCGVDGCDHLDCHGGPFRVVFVGYFVDEEDEAEVFTWASEYTSETGAFSEPSTIQLGCYIETRPSVLSGDALYFSLDQGKRILKYDLVGRSLSVIDGPQAYKQPEGIAVTSEDGSLGLVGVKDDSMYLWSWQVGSDGVSGWVQNKVIKLKTLLPILHVSDSFNVIGFAEGTNTILMSTDVGVFTIVLKSGQARKVGEQGSYYAVAPYTSFYTSDLVKGRLPLP